MCLHVVYHQNKARCTYLVSVVLYKVSSPASIFLILFYTCFLPTSSLMFGRRFFFGPLGGRPFPCLKAIFHFNLVNPVNFYL